MICAPIIEYLCRDEKISINICSQTQGEANRLANKYPRTRATCLNVTENTDQLTELCGQNDLVISLLPSRFHPLVAEKCIEVKTHMVTTSYMSGNVWHNFSRS